MHAYFREGTRMKNKSMDFQKVICALLMFSPTRTTNLHTYFMHTHSLTMATRNIAQACRIGALVTW